MNKTTLSLTARAACALLFTGATACAASDGPSDPRTTGESADELSITVPSFVTLRADMRRCVAPLCGGYFVRDVNRDCDERYVSGLDFTMSRLPEDVINSVRAAPTNEIVLRGHLSAAETRFHTHAFVVLDAYRGMPTVTPREGDAFYQVHARTPPIACFVAPCPNEIASLLNTTHEDAFDRVSVDRAALPYVDRGWLASRVETHQAVVAGAFANGQHFPGGYEQVLEASQVFVHLPDTAGPCTQPSTPACGEGTIALQERTADRCLEQLACVKPALCSQITPVCASGYTLNWWTAPPNGCRTFACDPTFILR